ncbi:ADP-heptose:LPS heptosyltransferase [Stella humosa]|uniref:ADP-heptose:LPS heptosyltransferase n=2 Tax=Stella humosa TaxID=94 RepID=A0A3N1L7N1_9PROT|nr:glycosyltransferase family 9 protein [Stella humosa]ROP90643.1 ADP-heptose:LPS heptosyltransferase [Stella humosa]
MKHGALGDLVQATGPMQAIRHHHPGARITLLTTRPFADFMAGCPWIDAVWVDDRPPAWNLPAVLRLGRRLRGGGFGRVYDLQTSGRSSRYLRFFGRPRPEWSGIAAGASHPHANPDRDRMHTLDRQREQLAMAGIARVPPPSLDWVADGPLPPGVPDRPFVLLVPGGSAHRPEKRWPIDRFAGLAAELAAAGIAPVVVGGGGERPLAAAIRAAAPDAVDLTGATGLADLVRLGRRAQAVVGNDTGPVHLLAVAGAPTVVLFSAASDPALCQPRGAAVRVLRESALADLGVGSVAAALAALAP